MVKYVSCFAQAKNMGDLGLIQLLVSSLASFSTRL